MLDKVYFFDKLDDVDIKYYNLMYSLLPDNRKRKVDNCYYEIDKKIKILEYFLIKNELNLEKNDDFSYTKNGKPYIKNKMFFNISHSQNALTIAFSDKNIGIDVQKMIQFDKKLLSHIASKKEYNIVVNSTNPNLEITKLWTKKESLIKYKAITIATNLKTLLKNEKLYQFQFFIKDEYVICLCKKR